MVRVIVNLKESEWKALRAQAERELRDLRDQARYLIVKGLAADLAAQADTSATAAAEIGGQDVQQN